ncbi:MAG: hypothetical protein ISP90_18575 [Nevskia sp.]|nr:hypothetical protein [Nevskia sp.]
MRLEAVEAVTGALNAHCVRFLVVDGLAVAAHGYLRYTADVDMVIQLDPANIREAFTALAEVGYRPSVPVTGEQFGNVELRSRWIAEKGMVVLNFWSDAHRDTPIDVFVSEPFDFDSEYSQGLAQELAPGVIMRFPRLDTLIKMKLSAGRPKDLIDVEYLRKARSA